MLNAREQARRRVREIDYVAVGLVSKQVGKFKEKS